eukprot:c25872_g1_i1 orf=322-1002(+)
MRLLCKSIELPYHLRFFCHPLSEGSLQSSSRSSLSVKDNGVLSSTNCPSGVSGLERDVGSAGLPFGDTVSVPPMSLIPRVVIYDGVCHLCNAGVRWVIKADRYKKISFCALQSQSVEPYLFACDLTREDVLRRFVFVEGPGMFSQASTAALRVLSYLPLPYSTLAVFSVIPAPLRDCVYDYVANRRYQWFGRSAECILPEENILDRFIDRDEILENRNGHSIKDQD